MSDTEQTPLARVLYVALLILPCLWAIGYFWPPLNHDAGALLQFADRMVGGERLYLDLIDINPPMVIWLDMIPAALSRMMGVSLPSALVGFLLAMFAGVLVFAWMIARQTLDSVCNATLLKIIAPVTLFCVLVYPAYSFAQREHLMFVAALPYLLVATARLDGQQIGPGTRIGASVIVALAIGMKPHFAAIAGLVELYVIVRLGWRQWLRDPAPWAILGVGILYIAAVLILTPAYLSFIVPLVMRYYATESGLGLGEMLIGDQLPALIALIAPLGFLASRRGGSDLARVTCLAAIGATLSAIAQHKGWDYHFLAARSFAILLLAITVADLFGKRAFATDRPTMLAMAVSVMATLFFLSGNLSPPFKAQREFARSPAGRLLPIVEREAAGKPVLWLTTSIYPQFPVLDYTGSKLAMPFMSLWLLPAIYDQAPVVGDRFVYTPPDAMQPAEALLFHSIGAELARLKPPLILVTRSSVDGGFHGHLFDYLEYFSRDPQFAAEFAGYRPYAQVDSLTIYKRVTP